jgi:hypothetical protein
MLEPLIYSKTITHNRDIRRGIIAPDPSLNTALAGYKARVTREVQGQREEQEVK